MFVSGSYEIVPLDRELSVGHGAVPVEVGVSIEHKQLYSQYSLKVTHFLSVLSFLVQQCSPSGLKCVGPRCRTTAAVLPTLLMNSSSPTAALPKTMGTAPPLGKSHLTPLGLLV